MRGLIPVLLSLALTLLPASGSAQMFTSGGDDPIPGVNFASELLDGIDFDVMRDFDLPGEFGLGRRATWWSFQDGGWAGRGSWGDMHLEGMIRRLDTFVNVAVDAGLADAVRAQLRTLDRDARQTLAAVERTALLLWWMASSAGVDDDLRALAAPLAPLLRSELGSLTLPRRAAASTGPALRLQTRRRTPIVPRSMMTRLELAPRPGSP